MTVVMTSKNQITIPKKIAQILRLKRGSIFDVKVSDNHIEFVPLEVSERIFSKDEYAKLDMLSVKESGKEKPMTKKYIASLKKR
jgi:AbrB family looped-hinge helix DNA binding protein